MTVHWTAAMRSIGPLLLVMHAAGTSCQAMAAQCWCSHCWHKPCSTGLNQLDSSVDCDSSARPPFLQTMQQARPAVDNNLSTACPKAICFDRVIATRLSQGGTNNPTPCGELALPNSVTSGVAIKSTAYCLGCDNGINTHGARVCTLRAEPPKLNFFYQSFHLLFVVIMAI